MNSYEVFLESLRRELIDFSRNNPLLAIARKKSLIRIVEPDHGELAGRLLAGGTWKFQVGESLEEDGEIPILFSEEEAIFPRRRSDEVRTTNSSFETLAASLRNIKRNADQEYTDKGLLPTCLTVGVLKWWDGRESWSSPLLLIPIVLGNLPNGSFSMSLSEEEDVVLNPSLVAKLSEEHEVYLDPIVSDDDPLGSLVRVAELASGHGWEVTFDTYLGNFSFKNQPIYKDLAANAGEILVHPVFRSLAEVSARSASDPEAAPIFDFEIVEGEELDRLGPPTSLNSILDADATQRQCILAAKAGHSFVIDGPPGTGKSQTIANIIAELLADGKTVLFVSEKMAALEVVSSRLERVGLDSFIMSLHGQKTSRKEFARSLGESAKEQVSVSGLLSTSELHELERSQDELNRYATAINDKSSRMGWSLHEAIGKYELLHDTINAPDPEIPDAFRTLTPEIWSIVQRSAEDLSNVWTYVEDPEEFYWFDLQQPEALARSRRTIQSRIEDLIRSLGALEEKSSEVAGRVGMILGRSLDDIVNFSDLSKMGGDPPIIPSSWLLAPEPEIFFEPLEQLVVSCEEYLEAEEQLATSLPDWLLIPLAQVQEIGPAYDRCHQRDVTVTPDGLWTLSELKVQIEAAEQVLETLDEALEMAGTLARNFGLSSTSLNRARIHAMAEAATLASNAHRPESLWFSAAGISAARDAVDLLRPLCEEYLKHREELGRLFDLRILETDLTSLFSSDDPQGARVGGISSIGRANKRLVASFTHDRRVTKEVREALVRVRLAQQERARLDPSDETQSALGTHYYRGPEANFEAILSAVEVAERALHALSEADPERLATALSRTALHVTDTALLGNRVVPSLDVALEAAKSRFNLVASNKTDLDQLRSTMVSMIDSWKALSESLSPLHLDEPSSSLNGALEIARTFVDLHDRASKIDAEIEGLRDILGPNLIDARRNPEEIRTAIRWAKAVSTALPEYTSESTAQLILAGYLRSDHDLDNLLEECRTQINWFSSLFRENRGNALRGELEGSIRDGALTLGSFIDHVTQVDEYARFVAAMDALANLGFGPILDFMVERRVPHADVQKIIEKAFIAAWIEAALEKNAGQLGVLSEVGRNNLVDRYRRIDEKLSRHAAAKLTKQLSSRRPQGELGPMKTIAREAQKKIRHMRIADLIEDSSEVILRIKPCFMMSPLSVSTFLPKGLKFDAVIFDEASQVRTSEAVNCIYRGHQVIIAGDEKQLGPTSFFERMADRDDDVFEHDEIDRFESVLTHAKGGALKSIPLQWHYRSRHESLITYSNYSFYKGKLVTFPSATAESLDLGVKFIHVPDGVYRRGGARDNPVEAMAVIDRAILHADQHPDLTLGIVAFSKTQEDTIEDALSKRLKERPDLRSQFFERTDEPFFIRSLERVQGDERDIILFSVGYGRDEAGDLKMNFGPVNQAGGERRLNVAFTRARQRLELISSLTTADFGLGLSPNVALLRKYFDYAENGIAALVSDLSVEGGEPESPFEEEVAATIRGWGYDVVSQVGQSGYRIDMAVRDPRDPNRFCLAVECDGRAYHSGIVARDRDRLRQSVLEGLGWRFHRIWGPSWYRQRNATENGLRIAIERAIEDAPIAGLSEYAGALPLEVSIDQVGFEDTPEWSTPYRKATRPKRVTAFDDAEAMTELLRFVIGIEGPISTRLLIDRTLELANVRATADRRLDLEEHIDRSVLLREFHEFEPGFYTLPTQGVLKVRSHSPAHPSDRRELVDIPRAELELAVVRTVEAASEIARSDARAYVAKRVFGVNRITQVWVDAISAAIDECVKRGSLVESFDLLSVNHTRRR